MNETLINPETIREGLNNDEFVYFYQSKVSLITGKVVGAEALIRWMKPDGKIITPNEFIPIAEQCGLIKEITYRMFPKLVRDLLIFLDIDSSLIISFNTTCYDFEDESFTKMALATLNQVCIPPKSLQIEITETTVLQADESVKKHIQTLCDAGMGLAMDDYGTGYATLETLSQWPFTTIKLDHSIVSHMQDSSKNLTIVEASIRMAHELDVAVVAEGVETEMQYQMLLEFGCTKVQGFWLSKPLRLDDFIYFIEQDLRWSGLPIGLIHMAVIDHIQWRKKITSDIVRIATTPLNSPERQAIYHLPMDYHECRLGKWYYGVGQRFKECRIFHSIEEPHQKFHGIGRQLIQIVTQGGTMRELTPLLTEFSDYSATILERLQQLEHKGLMDMHIAHQTWSEHHLHPKNQQSDDDPE